MGDGMRAMEGEQARHNNHKTQTGLEGEKQVNIEEEWEMNTVEGEKNTELATTVQGNGR